jgi:hypothetical protein
MLLTQGRAAYGGGSPTASLWSGRRADQGRRLKSLNTYLRIAEAVDRLDLTETEKSGSELIEDIT